MGYIIPPQQGGGGGAFIPLAGTEPGAPVTGTIEYTGGTIIRVNNTGGGGVGQIGLSEGQASMLAQIPGIGIRSLSMDFTGIAVNSSNELGTIQNSLIADETKIGLRSIITPGRSTNIESTGTIVTLRVNRQFPGPATNTELRITDTAFEFYKNGVLVHTI